MGPTGKLIKESDISMIGGGVISHDGDMSIIPTLGTGKLTIDGDLIVSQNLRVTGTTTSISTENVLIDDNCIYLNNGYTDVVALPGCLVVNYLPTPNYTNVFGSGFTAGVVGSSNHTVTTDNLHLWSPGDIVQISEANDLANNGLYELDSYANPLMTIRGIGINSTTFVVTRGSSAVILPDITDTTATNTLICGESTIVTTSPYSTSINDYALTPTQNCSVTF
jgi:hypothetical protein